MILASLKTSDFIHEVRHVFCISPPLSSERLVCARFVAIVVKIDLRQCKRSAAEKCLHFL